MLHGRMRKGAEHEKCENEEGAAREQTGRSHGTPQHHHTSCRHERGRYAHAGQRKTRIQICNRQAQPVVNGQKQSMWDRVQQARCCYGAQVWTPRSASIWPSIRKHAHMLKIYVPSECVFVFLHPSWFKGLVRVNVKVFWLVSWGDLCISQSAAPCCIRVPI